MRILAPLVFLAVVGPLDEALGYCSEPSAPFCATRYGSFDDQDDFERCKRQMASYRDDAESFLSCTRREADELKRKSDNVIQEYTTPLRVLTVGPEGSKKGTLTEMAEPEGFEPSIGLYNPITV
jgi:hypothetical protein